MANAVVEISPVNSRHSQLLIFVGCLLKIAADYRDGGQVFAAPFLMRTSGDLDLMPDFQVVAHENYNRIADEYLNGPADIAVEVVAFGCEPADRELSVPDYEEAGVAEYWVIDAENKVALFYQRSAENKLVQRQVGESGIYRSKVLPDLWLKEHWFWETPPPKLQVIMREWRLI
jgi:Uma2 family endonuclease